MENQFGQWSTFMVDIPNTPTLWIRPNVSTHFWHANWIPLSNRSLARLWVKSCPWAHKICHVRLISSISAPRIFTHTRYSPGNNVLGTAIWSFPKIGGYSICSIPNPIAFTMKNPNRFRNPSHQLSPTPQLQATASPLGPAPPVPPPPPSGPSKSAPAAAPAPPGVARRAGWGARPRGHASHATGEGPGDRTGNAPRNGLIAGAKWCQQKDLGKDDLNLKPSQLRSIWPNPSKFKCNVRVPCSTLEQCWVLLANFALGSGSVPRVDHQKNGDKWPFLQWCPACQVA